MEENIGIIMGIMISQGKPLIQRMLHDGKYLWELTNHLKENLLRMNLNYTKLWVIQNILGWGFCVSFKVFWKNVFIRTNSQSHSNDSKILLNDWIHVIHGPLDSKKRGFKEVWFNLWSLKVMVMKEGVGNLNF